MVHQRSPNRWSCWPTSLAMCLDVPVAELLQKLGHDGSEILWPEQPEPLRRQGFHPEELQYLCLREYSVVLACFVPCFGYNPVDALHEDRVYEFSQFEEVLAKHNGVLTGCYRRSNSLHAVAWNAAEERIYDADGVFATRHDFEPECFYAVFRTLR